MFARIRAAFDAHGIAIPSVSATFNAAHPDRDRRRRETAAAVELIARVPRLGASVATLCSGTRDAHDIWRDHRDNASAEAWSDMRATLDVLLGAAAAAGIRLGIEPEGGNVVRDAPTAARLLAELGPAAPVGIVLDPANLLARAGPRDRERILDEAIDLLGPRVVGVHLKGLGADGPEASPVLERLGRLGPVPLIVQDVGEAEATGVRGALLRRLSRPWAPSASASGG